LVAVLVEEQALRDAAKEMTSASKATRDADLAAWEQDAREEARRNGAAAPARERPTGT
jgi:hypothetical protein